MIRRISFLKCGLGLLLLFTLVVAPSAYAQTAPPVQPPPKDPELGLAPESLPASLGQSNAKLTTEIDSLQQQLETGRQALEQINQNEEKFRSKIAALKAALALKQINTVRAQEELGALRKRETAISGQIKEFEDKLKALNQEVQEKTDALNALEKEIASLKKANHPVWRSREMRAAYQKYQNLVREYQQQGERYGDILKHILATLHAEEKLLTETISHIQEEYLGKTLKGELLKRQTLQYRVAQLGNVLKTLVALPGKAHAWLTHLLQSGRLVSFIENYWAGLLGLLLFLLLLGACTHRAKAWVLPGLVAWKEQVPELGLTALLAFLQILVTHLFSMGLAAWLYVSFLTLGILNTKAAWLIFHGVAVLVALRLALKMIQSLFAGEAQKGVFPIPDVQAGYYRRHLKALAVYFFTFGMFLIPNARYLGFTPESGSFFRYLFQVALLGWVLWLLRKRRLDPVLERLPVPAFFKSKAFLRPLRGAVFLVLAFVVVSNLLGFRYLSNYVAEGASFTVVVAGLSWVLGQGAYAVLRLTLHPELGFLIQKHPEQQKFFSRLYRVLTKTVISALVAVAVLVALKVWGIAPSRLTWAFQWLAWGPSLGPLKLTPLNIGLTVLIFYLGFWVSRLIRTVMEFKFYPTTGWDPGIQYTISTTIHYVILVITTLIALNTIGLSFTSLALVAGGLGVGIGFGLQNIVSNFISGLILLFERPIKVGDMLVIDGQWGLVKEIKVRSTIFQTFDRYILIIPNSDLISGKILNWTHFGWGINRLTLKVGVSYGSDPRQVTKIIEEVCRANPRVIADPPPQIFFEAYGDSSLNFNVWVHLGNPSDRIPATHELNSAIFEAFQAHGIEIPFPQRDLHIRSWSPQAAPRPAPGSPAKE